MTAEEGASGPVSVYIGPDARQTQPPDYPGTSVELIVSGATDGADMYGGIVTLEPGVTITLHYHSQFEFQYVVSGSGVALDSLGGETPIAPGGAVLSPAHADGAHGFRANEKEQLKILFLYPTPGGHPPDRFEVGGG
ncbi:cupin domain-containing protein [Microbacterium halotolerans]|uniref:cupin domain-containing protein n=1 Tax=Microbacterium halotolerans TaxID=246613 RepID=UPI0013C3750A|nr:cupin domain-containing protein [Microbacterium halotolerans]